MTSLWESKEVEDATSGRSTCEWVASGVSIDTRTLKAGDLFIALKDVRDELSSLEKNGILYV